MKTSEEPDAVMVCLPAYAASADGSTTMKSGSPSISVVQQHPVGLEEDGALGDAEPDHHGRSDERHDCEGEAHE